MPHQPSPIFSFDNLRTIFPDAPDTSWRSDNPDEEVVVSFDKFKKSAPRLSESERTKPFTIFAIGKFSPGGHTALRACQQALSKCFHRDVHVQAMEDPKLVDSWRQSPLEGEDWPQANATGLLDNIQNASALFPDKIDMCIVPFDLWPGDDWNYVFGLAHCGDGGLSVTSLWRLGDFDGHRSGEAILRAVKTVIHEAGHVFGLDHCVEHPCCMNGSNNYADGELQPLEFCPSCLQKLSWKLDLDPLRHIFDMQRLCAEWGFATETARYEEMIASSTETVIYEKQGEFFISAHGDTNYDHAVVDYRGRFLYGTLDNFVGVKAVMDASFEGHLNGAQVEITYGEERDMEGAAEIASLVAPEDIVVVVDVTGYLTDVDVVIEKCSDPWLQKLVEQSFQGAPFSYEILDGCQDPISQIDETSIYKQVTDRCLLLAIPCDGGDYNSHIVRCRPSSIRAASQALQLLFGQFVKQGRK